MRHLLQLFDLSKDELVALLQNAARLKAARKRGVPSQTLSGKVVGLVFEKPSLRTRVSFESGIAQLGGTSLFMPGSEVGLGWRESLADFARTMSRFVDAMVFRVFKQETVQGIAAVSGVPVINALSDDEHPCQALADLLTIEERLGTVAGKTIAFVGDGNNVAKSLAVGCGRLGAKFVLGCPAGYGFEESFSKRFASEVGGSIGEVNDPTAAVKGADVIYTDVWTSMGQEAEKEVRLKAFAPFQLNGELMKKAPSHAIVLHCLPAHRGEEITHDVVESSQSVVFDQAENRLHVQKAVMEYSMAEAAK
ncbi:MAG: ornithine carbamoyltransferase [Gemmataceae bacterium]